MAHLPKTIKRTSTQYRKGEKGTLPCWRNLADTTWTKSLGSTSPVLLCRYHTPCDRTWCDVTWRTLHLFSKSRDPSLTWENTREMQIEAVRYPFTPTGMAGIKSPNNKPWRRGEIRPVCSDSYREWKTVRPLRKTGWQFLKQLNRVTVWPSMSIISVYTPNKWKHMSAQEFVHRCLG